jgi:hypothetical protein
MTMAREDAVSRALIPRRSPDIRARWNGQALQVTTGTVSPRLTHCQ